MIGEQKGMINYKINRVVYQNIYTSLVEVRFNTHSIVLSIDSFQRLHLHGSISAVCSVSLDILGVEQFHQLLAHEVGLIMAVVTFKVFHYEDKGTRLQQ